MGPVGPVSAGPPCTTGQNVPKGIGCQASKKDIDECVRNPCQHGTCVNKDGGYKCTCSPGWTGQNCQQDLNECNTNPCQHGRCENQDGGYKCTCSAGRTGQYCHQARPCQHGWSEHNNHCYKLMNEKVSFSTANQRCKGMGANLASIRDGQENNFIASIISDASGDMFWIGLKYNKWMDGSEFPYRNWAPGQPDDHWFSGGEKCVVIYKKKTTPSTMECIRPKRHGTSQGQVPKQDAGRMSVRQVLVKGWAERVYVDLVQTRPPKDFVGIPRAEPEGCQQNPRGTAVSDLICKKLVVGSFCRRVLFPG
ncbi:hypothetical protein Bbelb_377640 [Branchiostoma belcheri]|nr:hypothetical protein Bbelb_377640 [Branchiostoma belcheri]